MVYVIKGVYINFRYGESEYFLCDKYEPYVLQLQQSDQHSHMSQAGTFALVPKIPHFPCRIHNLLPDRIADAFLPRPRIV